MGDAGVGGGGVGASSLLFVLSVGVGFLIDVRDVFEELGVSVSVSLPEEASSSQLSATGLDLAFAADLGEVLVEMVRCSRVCATSR